MITFRILVTRKDSQQQFDSE